MLGFKELVQDERHTWIRNKSEGFNDYGDLLEDLLSPYATHNGSTVALPPDIVLFRTKLSVASVDVDLIMVDPATLTNLQYAAVAQEVYRFLFEERMAHWDLKRHREIFRHVGKNSDWATLATCQDHAFLNGFIPCYLRNPHSIPGNKVTEYNAAVMNQYGVGPVIGAGAAAAAVAGRPILLNGYIFPPNFSGDVHLKIGELLVKLNRHLVVHPLKLESVDTFVFMPFQSAINLLTTLPTRDEVIQMGRYTFGRSLSLSLAGFKLSTVPRNSWDLLGVRKIVPIPSIHYSEGR